MRIIMKADKESGMFMKIYFDMDSFDYPQELRNNWNKRLRSMRIIALLLSILMMILGVVCFLYPVKTMGVLEKSAAFLILVAGVYEIINYFKLQYTFVRHLNCSLVSVISFWDAYCCFLQHHLAYPPSAGYLR